MTTFQEELSRALYILEAEHREVLVQRLRDYYKNAFVKLKRMDGPIVVPDETYGTIRSIHAAINTIVGKAFLNQPKMREQFRNLNDLLLSVWTTTSSVRPAGLLDATHPALISAITQSLEEWFTIGQQAINPIDATYLRRFKEWSNAVKDAKAAYQAAAVLF